MKYCFACGQALPADAKFCTKCGQRQEALTATTTDPVASTAVTQPQAQPQSQAPSPAQSAGSEALQDSLSQATGKSMTDVGLGLLTKGVLDAGPLMKSANVIQHKVQLGYSDSATNFVYVATPLEWKDLLTVGGLTGMSSQNYVMCFEPNGILLMGCIGLAKFNEDNHFIENADVDQIDLEKAALGAEWDHMYLVIKGETLELLVQHPTFSLIKWHRNNFKLNLNYTV
ncbi:zinc ribbon domain-containing protein [Lactiplantibacillus carotarum]|uniref:zinc ribbon domain-containing protein n=1 Tax=Lactiplantibacillus carotarum TaxID=2993456 RepID=UPI00298F0F1E|nr:zinc ribbon domain-containing protein [Lactiplantibacillus carotarum]